ncbi:unnamed protein product [Meloidogyne enterolobii]|uniref:Uncharacterized protein n=1 Tax=Meloidogyne enterolobii TaxID=390850 RepID=A0ACB0XKJ3_MELEN
MKNILEVLNAFEDNLGENKINLETLTETSFRQTSCNFFNKLRKSWSSFTKQVLTSLTTENINIDVLLGKMLNVYRFLSFGMFYNLEIKNKFVENFERIFQQQTNLKTPNSQNILNKAKNDYLIKQLRIKTISMFLAKNTNKIIFENKNYLIFEKDKFLKFFGNFIEENGIINLDFFEKINYLFKEKNEENENKMINFVEENDFNLKKFAKKLLNKIERQMNIIDQEKLGKHKTDFLKTEGHPLKSRILF